MCQFFGPRHRMSKKKKRWFVYAHKVCLYSASCFHQFSFSLAILSSNHPTPTTTREFPLVRLHCFLFFLSFPRLREHNETKTAQYKQQEKPNMVEVISWLLPITLSPNFSLARSVFAPTLCSFSLPATSKKKKSCHLLFLGRILCSLLNHQR